MQQAHPGAHPSQYMALDKDFARFARCGYDSMEGYGAALRGAPTAAAPHDGSPGAAGQLAPAAGSSVKQLVALQDARDPALGAGALCSQSEFDPREQRCLLCKQVLADAVAGHYDEYTEYVPGGHACCGAANLAQCPRPWL